MRSHDHDLGQGSPETATFRRILLVLVIGSAARSLLPVQPLNAFGKRQPMSRNVFKRLSETWVGSLCGALFGHQSATAIIFSTRVHPDGQP